ncbi:MAG: ATPase, T2SS/T4P/T4SS family [Myxococcota bacterium]
MTPAVDLEQLERLLGEVRLFSRLPRHRLGAVLRRMQALQFHADRVILEEGRPIKFMFILGQGSVEVRRKEPTSGIPLLLRTLQAGDSFGEMALLTGAPYTVNLTTTEPTILFVLNQENFRSLISEEPELSLTLNQLLAEQLINAYDQVGIQLFELADVTCPESLLAQFPRQLVLLHRVLPIEQKGRVLRLAMVNPGDLIAHDDVKRHLRDVTLQPVLISESDFEAHVDRFFPGALQQLKARNPIRPPSPAGTVPPPASPTAAPAPTTPASSVSTSHPSPLLGDDDLLQLDEALGTTAEEKGATLTDLEAEIAAGPIIKLANSVLVQALKRGASDVHIEPQSQGLVVRYRIDGNLQVIQVLPPRLSSALVSRYKILSNLDITERRVPQDGRISSAYQGRRIDFRVSTVPGKYGEKICLRILDNSLSSIHLEKLILHPETYNRFRQLIDLPHGIIFVTGPTGSGKTTTLYSALGEINTPDINISTAEDPIEYDMAGITQVQVQRAVGVDFARILRAFLRQDPDVILVGETRDSETAKTAVEAALTGHLVFTTLHTNSAAASFPRLEEMGVEPFMVGCATVGVVAQRLARRLCPDCKISDTPPRHMLDFLGFGDDEVSTVMKAVGCPKCNHQGFRGRVGVYEVMVMNDELRPLVAKRRPIEELEAAAVQQGMLTLAGYGRWLIRNGLTTLEEVLRVVAME